MRIQTCLVSGLAIALAACGDPPAPAPDAGAGEPASPAAVESSQPEPAAPAVGNDAPAGTPAFVDKVWRVVESDGVQPGTTYAFLADGTLVIDSGAGNPPGYGKWTMTDGKLVIEEEGVSYPTDIVGMDAATLSLRSHNPGGTLDIKLERLPDAPLPSAP